MKSCTSGTLRTFSDSITRFYWHFSLLPDFRPREYFLGIKSQKPEKTGRRHNPGAGGITLALMLLLGIGTLLNFDQLFYDLHLLIFYQ